MIKAIPCDHSVGWSCRNAAKTVSGGLHPSMVVEAYTTTFISETDIKTLFNNVGGHNQTFCSVGYLWSYAVTFFFFFLCRWGAPGLK